MTRLDMVRAAVRELGEAASHEQLSAFVRTRFGEDIAPRFIPLFRATLRGEDLLRGARERAARLVAEDRPARRRKAG